MEPVSRILSHTPPLEAKGDRPLQMTFEHQLKALIFYHLEEYSSGGHLIQALKEDDFAKNKVAPPDGIKKSSFFEAINHRGLEQLLYIFEKLQAETTQFLPNEYAHLGDLVELRLSTKNIQETLRKKHRKSKATHTHTYFDCESSCGEKYMTVVCGIDTFKGMV